MVFGKRLTARLPATPCTPEMRGAFEKIQQEHKCDLAELQRAAFDLFLSQPDIKSVVYGTENSNEERTS